MRMEEGEEQMNKKSILAVILKTVLGLACLGLAAYLLLARWWYKDMWALIKGSSPLMLVLVGAVLLAVARD